MLAMGRNAVKWLGFIALIVVAVLTIPTAYEQITNSSLTGKAQAQDDNPTGGLSCEDFEAQAAAQQTLREDPSDPNVLDEEVGPDDGIACETFDYLVPDRDEDPVVAAIGNDDLDLANDDTITQSQPSNQNAVASSQLGDDRNVPRRNNQRRDDGLFAAGGPLEPPYPTLMNGECPQEFPIKQPDGCYPR